MRILAIRGCNITSLAGEFQLELDEPPLKNVGLFTITGPTGAGKSSLLDALCLALFGTAPRLDRVAKVRVGLTDDEGDRLFADDPRSLVRRGQSHGYAEVDYVGEGGHRYRARWEARRARNRITGRFQPATVSLRNLDTEELIASGKEEKERAIQRTLGLSYEQFRRSALLAQGDFAAFLQERGDKRAELLAQMTGTQLYERISKIAHERAKKAADELRLLSESVAAIALLDDEARQALVAKIDELTKAKATKAREVEELEKVVRHFDEATKLREAEAQAVTELDRAREALDGLSELIHELGSVERALPLKPLVVAEAQASKAKAEAETQLAIAEEALSKARESLAESEALSTARLEDRKRAETALDEARPVLAQASKLDAVLREKEERLVSLRKQVEQAGVAKDEASRELKTVESRVENVERQSKGLEQWLGERIRIARLVEQWELYRSEMQRFVLTFGEANQARDALSKLERENADAKRALAEIETAVAKARTELETTKAAHDEAAKQAEASAFSDALRDERDALRSNQQAIEAMLSLAAQAQNLTKQQQIEQGNEATARMEAEDARREAAEAEQALPRVEGQLAEAKRALDQTRTTIDLAAHRAKLRDGVPCPLCGSTEHPYAKDAGPLAELLVAHEENVREREQHLQSLRERRSRAQTKAEALARTAEEAKERLTTIEAQLDDLHTRWKELGSKVALESSPTQPEALDVLRERRSGIETRLAELREAERRAADWAEKARRRQSEWQLARTRLDALVQKHEAAKERAREAETAWSRHAEALERSTRSLDEIAATLAPAFEGRDGWRERLFQTPAEFFENRKREVEAYRQRNEELSRTKEELSTLRAQRDKAAAILDERAKSDATLREELAIREEELAGDRAERAKLFEGRAVIDVQTELEGALAKATKALEEAKQAEQKARDEVQGAAQKLAAAETAHELALRDAEAKGRELAEKLASTGFDRPTLDALLSHDDVWLDASRMRIDEARTKLKEAEIRLGERQKARAEHEAEAPQPSEDEARTQLTESREALQATTDGLAEAQAELRRDEEARRLHSSKEEELARARKDAERWKALDQLIGSADGKKFRTFAQSITLDALLAYANEHLRDLAPRYRLMRVPGHDMELQIIDSDMANEVRGTNSLSGGETFLVSLALALALSSLASREVRIDTLFIDEGFGALDPQTLDIAISALESLQATGRQVGVISHVRALSEKIGTQVRVQRLGAGRSRLVLGQKGSEVGVFG